MLLERLAVNRRKRVHIPANCPRSAKSGDQLINGVQAWPIVTAIHCGGCARRRRMRAVTAGQRI